MDRVYVVELPSNTPSRVSNDTVGECNPVWSPDGSSVSNVTWHDAAGGSIRRATRAPRAPVWRVSTLTSGCALYTRNGHAYDAHEWSRQSAFHQ